MTKSGIDSIDQFQALLHNQNYHCDLVDEDKIYIRGIARMNTLVAVILSVCGATLIMLGIASFTLENPEILGGIAFILVGLFLILIPYYNFYSKKNFMFKLEKSKKRIELRTAGLFEKKKKFAFSEVSKVYLKQKKVNTFVDNTSPSSYATYYSIGLKLTNGKKPTLLHFPSHSSDLENMINQITDRLSSYLDVEIEHIEDKEKEEPEKSE